MRLRLITYCLTFDYYLLVMKNTHIKAGHYYYEVCISTPFIKVVDVRTTLSIVASIVTQLHGNRVVAYCSTIYGNA